MEGKEINTTGQGAFGTSRTGTSDTEAGSLGSSSGYVSTPLAGNQVKVFSNATGRKLWSEADKTVLSPSCRSDLNQPRLQHQTLSKRVP